MSQVAFMKMRVSNAKIAALQKNHRNRMVFNADGRIRVVWDLLNVIMLCWTCFEIPFTIVFLEDSCDWDWHAALNLMIDIFFLVDIVLTFFTTFIDDLGGIVADHK